MSTFVFVHGAFHGSWCWAKVVSALQRAGHNAATVDLPGRAGDTTGSSLDDYVRCVSNVVRLQDRPVILVGHSLAGVTIGQVAEEIPNSIRALVYVCAFLLVDGQTVDELVAADGDSLLHGNLAIDEAMGRVAVLPDAPLREMFYGACRKEDIEHVRVLLVDEPVSPARTTARITAARYGRVPRFYVECTEDKAVTLPLQRQMYAAAGCQEVFTLVTDHSPFFSAAAELVEVLAKIAAVVDENQRDQ